MCDMLYCSKRAKKVFVNKNAGTCACNNFESEVKFMDLVLFGSSNLLACDDVSGYNPRFSAAVTMT